MPTLTVITNIGTSEFSVREAELLLGVLKRHRIEVYGTLSKHLNCGGRGFCATCGVRIEKGTAPPVHWHDRLAARFGYPRLTCQIRIREDLTISIPENKIMWGQLFPDVKRGND